MRCAIVRQSIDAHLDLVGEDTLGGELQQHAADDRRRPITCTFHGFLPQDRRLDDPVATPISTCSRRCTRRRASRCSKPRRQACPSSARARATSRTGRRSSALAIDDAIHESLAGTGDSGAARRSDRARARWRRWRRRSRSTHDASWVGRRGSIELYREVARRLDRRRQRQVQAAHAAPARLVALDVERLPEGDRRRRIQRFFETRRCGTVGGMKETRPQRCRRARAPPTPTAHCTAPPGMRRRPPAPGSTAGCDRATRVRRRRSRRRINCGDCAIACVDRRFERGKVARRRPRPRRCAPRVQGSGRLNADDDRSAARNEISSKPRRCAAAMVCVERRRSSRAAPPTARSAAAPAAARATP